MALISRQTSIELTVQLKRATSGAPNLLDCSPKAWAWWLFHPQNECAEGWSSSHMINIRLKHVENTPVNPPKRLLSGRPNLAIFGTHFEADPELQSYRLQHFECPMWSPIYLPGSQQKRNHRPSLAAHFAVDPELRSCFRHQALCPTGPTEPSCRSAANAAWGA